MKKFLIDGRPTVTVMVQSRTLKRAAELIEKGLSGGADAFGIQIEQMDKKFRTEENFKMLFETTGGKPAYITNYRTALNTGMTDSELAQDIINSARYGGTLIDVMGDLFCPSKDEITLDASADKRQRELIEKIHFYGSQVLISSHTYRFLNTDEVLKIAEIQANRGADVIKIVTAAETPEQLYENFETTARLKRELDKPFLFLCVGEYCKKHRITAPLICDGPFLCVAEYDELATPVQPLLSKVRETVDTVYKNIR